MNNKKTLLCLATLISINSWAYDYMSINNTRKINDLGNIYINNTITNKPMEIFLNKGKYYLAGNAGDQYEINICPSYNNYSENKEIRNLYVVSVDGLNVISGEPAGYNQSGYVVSSYTGCTKIKGWRKNMNEEASFILTPQSSSYNALTNNDKKNIGVIGIARFNEKKERILMNQEPMFHGINNQKSEAGLDSNMNSVPAPSRLNMEGKQILPRQEEKLGTGHGRIINSEATQTNFKKSSEMPERIIVIEYDSYENLVKKGVIAIKTNTNISPNPFPSQLNFAPDPIR